MKLPLSVFIIAKNEEDRIFHTINSVIDWVDEVIVIDSGSTDNTVALAISLGATVVYHEWQGYGLQKIYGESLCKNDWILNLDADEELSSNLIGEIIELFKKEKFNFSAYRLKIVLKPRFKNHVCGYYPSNSPIRLYNKNKAGFSDSSVHDSVLLREGEIVGKLKNIVIHRCFRDLKHSIDKINFYSSMQADDIKQKGRKICSLRMILEPFAAFFKAYFLRRYFLFGIDGFIESFIYAFARMIRLAKSREP